MTAMGVALPHYINPDKITPGTRGVDETTKMLIYQTITWIREYGAQYGWEKVTEDSTNFNKGYTSQVYSSDMRENEIEYYIHK